jgi:hypothetical protein
VKHFIVCETKVEGIAQGGSEVVVALWLHPHPRALLSVKQPPLLIDLYQQTFQNKMSGNALRARCFHVDKTIFFFQKMNSFLNFEIITFSIVYYDIVIVKLFRTSGYPLIVSTN